ncbi:protein spaetzle 5 [Cimex lectularius]|uniref:Spaetzle domain-containing protein n=1 Tax=Cimex lectularius TaxID=79782 RepID=A0A8I6RL39_CIMLE|nr:protein spaetzle 5 [Cimex lectularius]
MPTQLLHLCWVFVLIAGLEGSPPCSQYGCQQQPAFKPYFPPRQPNYVPAPPGMTPPCAKSGKTYCVDVDEYPQQLITTLVSGWQYNYNTLLANEMVEGAPPRDTYGLPPNKEKEYPYPGPSERTLPPSHQYIIFNATTHGYPDRRYRLEIPNVHITSNDPGFIYSAIIRPDLVPPVTHYDSGSWWKRFMKQNRQTRQAKETLTLCPTKTHFIMPKAAINNQGNWKYVVNLDQDRRFTQLVGSETCASTKCNGICSLPNGYTSKCQQHYVQKRLIALDDNGNSLYTDLFWLPHCCLCQISPSGS